MVESSLIKKLGIEPKQHVIILNAPEGYFELIASMLPTDAELVTSSSPDSYFDVVILFVHNKAEVEKDTRLAINLAKSGGRLWISYPKQSSRVSTDINRDILWKIFPNSEWRPVTQISIDEIWSALRFRPKTEVGT